MFSTHNQLIRSILKGKDWRAILHSVHYSWQLRHSSAFGAVL